MAFVAVCSFCRETKPTVCVYERSWVSPNQYGLCSKCARRLCGCDDGFGINGEILKIFKLVPVGEFTAHLMLSRMPVEKRNAVSCGCESCHGTSLECVKGCKHKKHICCPIIPRGNFVVYSVETQYPFTVCARCLYKYIEELREADRPYRIFMLEQTSPKKFARGYRSRDYQQEDDDNPDRNQN